ncbi:MAG: hypothetical protein P4N41_25745 [Negativicutes bacterium]|nr:hypothetical protein [Negativicutes bacterium]MDR3593079.1 hypothetical protein [Negativicutes bacterium]
MRLVGKWFCYLEKHWVGITFTWSFVFAGSALYGYWSEGLITGKWDIMAMWAGITALFTAASAAYGKWWTISKYNTPPGQPAQMGDDCDDPG